MRSGRIVSRTGSKQARRRRTRAHAPADDATGDSASPPSQRADAWPVYLERMRGALPSRCSSLTRAAAAAAAAAPDSPPATVCEDIHMSPAAWLRASCTLISLRSPPGDVDGTTAQWLRSAAGSWGRWQSFIARPPANQRAPAPSGTRVSTSDGRLTGFVDAPLCFRRCGHALRPSAASLYWATALLPDREPLKSVQKAMRGGRLASGSHSSSGSIPPPPSSHGIRSGLETNSSRTSNTTAIATTTTTTTTTTAITTATTTTTTTPAPKHLRPPSSAHVVLANL